MLVYPSAAGEPATIRFVHVIKNVKRAGKFVPPAGKVLFIVGQDSPALSEYVHGTGVVPGGTMLYTSLQQLEGLETKHSRGGVMGMQDGRLRLAPEVMGNVGLRRVLI